MTFYLPKFVLVGSLWVSAMILASWQKLNTAKDPTYSYQVETEKFDVCHSVAFCTFYMYFNDHLNFSNSSLYMGFLFQIEIEELFRSLWHLLRPLLDVPHIEGLQ